jgi:large subunit ribosomal protein L23
VTVTDVATINVRGKMRRRGIRTGYTSRWKKAIVTLAAGNTIDVFEGM